MLLVVVATSTTVIINDTSQESSGTTNIPIPMLVPPSPPAPVGNAGGGTGSLKGSVIYHEWFQYTSSPSEPTPTCKGEHVPDTQSVHIDLQYRPALTSANDAPAGDQPNELPSDS